MAIKLNANQVKITQRQSKQKAEVAKQEQQAEVMTKQQAVANLKAGGSATKSQKVLTDLQVTTNGKISLQDVQKNTVEIKKVTTKAVEIAKASKDAENIKMATKLDQFTTAAQNILNSSATETAKRTQLAKLAADYGFDDKEALKQDAKKAISELKDEKLAKELEKALDENVPTQRRTQALNTALKNLFPEVPNTPIDFEPVNSGKIKTAWKVLKALLESTAIFEWFDRLTQDGPPAGGPGGGQGGGGTNNKCTVTNVCNGG